MANVQNIVAEKIIKIMEQNEELVWQKPWTGEIQPASFATKRQYSGINKLLLGFVAATQGYETPLYGTFKQIEKLGGSVKRGEKSYPCCFWKPAVTDTKTNKFLTDKELSELDLKYKNATEKEKAELADRYKDTLVFRYYNVFNLDQVNWPEGVRQNIIDEFKQKANAKFAPKEEIESILRNYINAPVIITTNMARAEYVPSKHTIYLPKPESFVGDDDYYKTWFHEAVHSTGHHSILNRKMHSRLDIEEYSFEELIAELGAAMLVQKFRLKPKVDNLENSAAYVKSWLAFFRNDPKVLIKATQKAQKAVEWITEKQKNKKSVA